MDGTVKEGWDGNPPPKPPAFQTGKIKSVKSGINEDTQTLSGTASSLDEFLEKLDVDMDIWEVASVKITDNDWTVASKQRDQSLTWSIHDGADGNKVQLMEGYSKRGGWEEAHNKQVKFEVTLKLRTDFFDRKKYLSEMYETVRMASPYVQKRKYAPSGRHLMEINIFDLHLDAIADALMSGYDWNFEAARDTFFAAIEKFIRISEMYGIERIVFPYGNDFFNSDKDFPVAQTTSGTLMRNDIRWQQMFREGRNMFIEAVLRLEQIAPVDLLLIPGNHDAQKAFFLGEVLDVKFENNENVNVDNSFKSRKYYRYGNSLIGYTHGRSSDIPEQRLLHLMPQEAPELWAKTKYHEWHCGDIHHEKGIKTKASEDMNGITIRWMKNLRPPDLYEHDHGFFKMGGAEASIWHRETGLEGSINFNL